MPRKSAGPLKGPRSGYLPWLWRFRLYVASSRARRWIKKGWNRFFPGTPIRIRVAPGFWWKAAADVVGDGLFDGSFERAERRFVNAFLKPGMVVLDVGAHHGLYSLLSSRVVGASGKVIAFEPSPRERERLQEHLLMNHTQNVEIVPIALGSDSGRKELVLAADAGYNTLAAQALVTSSDRAAVDVLSLDEFVAGRSLPEIDLIKVDVEGGELDVLRGAESMLRKLPRPVLLCEVEDRRTEPWGYAARDIIRHLQSRGFRWYRPLQAGGVRAIDPERHVLDSNFVAIPTERLGELAALIKDSEF